ncbi:hypothetical protein Rumeso_00727 [Rubellimicrobium mesophilum DSM 19309]|uniref:Uncharacterized protein n=1 Tax=Rubellimicrobium mesophilum DSM 19309 TaxID=442562 RepID=A0A017HT78_9RHOB|nr:DUF6766 family protein [Rubellimicrobium mesophilum]EYD77561.1 hypothetical protein Rumeso_00727 [Rubellimicrobium mesophilum DSM 19309]
MSAAQITKPPVKHFSIWKRYGYTWVTAVLFAASLVGHWALAWGAYAEDQRTHGQEPELKGYLLETGRDTLENWQSEFLQLIWQVAGLSLLLHVGSPQSREEDDRLEEKIDAILRAVSPKDADRILAELDARFDKGEPVA